MGITFDGVGYIIADVELKDGLGRIISESVEKYSEYYAGKIDVATIDDENAFIALNRMRSRQLEPFDLSVVPTFDFIDFDIEL